MSTCKDLFALCSFKTADAIAGARVVEEEVEEDEDAWAGVEEEGEDVMLELVDEVLELVDGVLVLVDEVLVTAEDALELTGKVSAR